MSRTHFHFMSRRSLLRTAIAAFPIVPRRIRGQSESEGKSDATSAKSKPAKEWENAYLMAVSPNGRRLCLYFTKHPLSTFTFRGTDRKYQIESATKEKLSVIETVSWHAVFTTRLHTRPGLVSFFRDNNTIYIQTLLAPPIFRTFERIAIALESGTFSKRAYTRAPNDLFTDYYALNYNTLLGVEFEPNPSKAIYLTRAALPEYKEIGRMPYTIKSATVDDQPSRNRCALVSADRGTFVYTTGQSIVLRRTDSLGIMWSRDIEPGPYCVRHLGATPNGNTVAAAVVNVLLEARNPMNYIAVYGDQSGQPLAKLKLDGEDGLAISPDGRLLAVGRSLSLDKDFVLLVETYEVSSGRRINAYLHDTVPPGKYQHLVASLDAIEFTSDSKYLITSGNNRVKAWEV
jgi:hypothetical protein